jgi:hypothetical protein
VRSVVHNDVYRGMNIWNKRKQSDRWGQRACRLRPEADWIRADVPQWRIVSDEEWDAAHWRLEQAAAVYIRSTDGKRWGRPPAGVQGKYLLSGLLRCACCGASLTVGSAWAFVVTDPATTARNAVTAVLRSQIVDTIVQQHDHLRRMARRLSAYTTLDKYAVQGPPRRRAPVPDPDTFISKDPGVLRRRHPPTRRAFPHQPGAAH